MEQPLGFVAQGESDLVCKFRRSLYGLKQSPRAWFRKFSQVVQNFGTTRSEPDHSVFYCHSSFGKCVYLILYVNDIVITGNDDVKIFQLNHFQTKYLGHLKYFFGIEVAQSKEGIVISQRKYALDILQEASMSNCRPVDSPMDPNMKLMVKQNDFYFDPERYRRLVGKLIYLTITRPDFSFAVVSLCRHLTLITGQQSSVSLDISRRHLDRGDTHISGYCNVDWARSPIDRRSTIGSCISIGGNVVSWKSKKQNTITHSSTEPEYRAMTSATYESIWVKQLIQELKFVDVQPMKLYCDNQATLHIASNPVFHERTKHIEIDCYFVREKLLAKEISTEFVNSNNQLADIFTKSLRGPSCARSYWLYGGFFDLAELTEDADAMLDISVNMTEIAKSVGVDTNPADGAKGVDSLVMSDDTKNVDSVVGMSVNVKIFDSENELSDSIKIADSMVDMLEPIEMTEVSYSMVNISDFAYRSTILDSVTNRFNLAEVSDSRTKVLDPVNSFRMMCDGGTKCSICVEIQVATVGGPVGAEAAVVMGAMSDASYERKVEYDVQNQKRADSDSRNQDEAETDFDIRKEAGAKSNNLEEAGSDSSKQEEIESDSGGRNYKLAEVDSVLDCRVHHQVNAESDLGNQVCSRTEVATLPGTRLYTWTTRTTLG
ncbi:Copia protein, partial [Mucuna pruriens]